jgi:hypothetical protein
LEETGLSELIRVKNWKKFKELANELKPKAIVYSIDQNGKTKNRELTCLRLIMPIQNKYFVYIDFPKGKNLRQTGIPIHEKKDVPRYLEDQDIISFLKKQLQIRNLHIHSFWTA